MTKRHLTIITALSLIIMVLALLISRRLWFRLDLTKNRAYTLSPVSRELHREIPDQVRITYYLSAQLASAYPQPGEIEDLLREYAARSRGKIRYTRRDPVRTGHVQAMEQMGIPALQIETVEKDQATVATVYAGVAVEYLERLEVLPVALSLDTLEYDVTSRIRSLIRDTPREAGVIVGDSFRQWDRDYAALNRTLLQAGFRVRPLNPGDEIPDTLPALFVFGGAEDLDEWALYRIDRYIQGGGKVFFAPETIFVDGTNLETRVMIDKGLLSMVSFYGATVKPELALDQNALNISYQIVGAGGIPQFRIVRYPLWIGVGPEGASLQHPLTARFGGLDLFWPHPLELSPPRGVEAEVLFSSSPRSWLMTRDFTASPEAGYLFEQEAPDTRGPKVLGAALSGTFPSWFAGLPKPVREGSAEELPDLPAGARPSRIVVVGDADMAGSLLEYTRSQHNLDFMLRVADWLGSDEEIIGIRSRQGQAGRLDRIPEPEKRAAAMNFARVLNLGIVPLAVILAGVFLAWKRRTAAGSGEEPSHGV